MGKAKSVLIGVTGGIAAYKIPELVRMMHKRKIKVRIAMTKGAEMFVTPMTLETVSGQKVWRADWQNQKNPLEHLTEGESYDMALIAPATANFIGKMAGGLADDLLSTLILSLTCPIFIVPAMNPRMFANPAVTENLERLKRRNLLVINPDEGDTACGEKGEGRLPELDRLMAVVEQVLGLRNDMDGMQVLVTAGRTEEPIDSVRYISNRSSGKMGIAIACAAAELGAKVTLIHGPVSETLPETTRNISVRQADEMFKEVEKHFNNCDVLIMTAAVADFKPATVINGKIKKHAKGTERSIALVENRDILETLGRKKQGQILVGFAAETENWIKNGREKMLRKNIDLICVNDVSRNDIGFDNEYNEIVFINRTGEPEKSSRLTKKRLAFELLNKVLKFKTTKDKTAVNRNA